MTESSLKFYRAVGMMVGAIVGVGVFGLPFVFARTGFALTLIELLVMGGLLTILQLMQAEVAIQTKGKHRMVGFVRHYLGLGWSRVVMVAMAGGVWGAMIAYMIVGGKFLYLLLFPLVGGTELIYALLVAAISSALIYRGLRFAAKIEVIVVSALLFLFLFIILACIPHINPAEWMTVSWSHTFAPYGVILFALAGVGVVPELHEVLGKYSKARLGHVIFTGMALIIALYALFSAAVVGVTGSLTTAISFEGLVPVLGETFRVFATGLGTLTILSIYFMLGIQLLNTLKVDFSRSHNLSWLIVVLVPVIAYVLGAREFIQVIGFVGAFFAGTLGIFVVLTYQKMKKSSVCTEHHCLYFPTILSWLLIGLFVVGLLFEIFSKL